MKLKTLKVKSSKVLCSAFFALVGLTAFAQSPGGVSTNLTLWLKADNPATITGSPVQTWSTSGGSAAGYSVTQATSANRPTLRNGATNYNNYNYNPSVQFNSGSSTKLIKTSGSPDLLGSNGTAIIVTHQDPGTGSVFTFYSGSTGRYQLKPRFRFQTGMSGTGYTFDWSTPTEYSTTAASIITSYGCASNAALRKNSVQVTSPNNSAALYNPSIVTGLYLGANNSSEYSNSAIAEVILFNAKPTLAEMDRVESYLAIKYGITRGGNTNTTGTYNYVASDGFAILWNKAVNTGFNNDIAVIGRDDNSGLAQKQSISVNNGEAVTISLGNGAIPTENATNTATFANNLSFLAWGNNGLTKVFNPGATKPSGVLERLNRVWKTQKTNFSQQATFGFENVQITGLGTTGNLCLLFDDDGTDLSNAVVVAACSAVNTGTRTEFRGIDIPAGMPYFTLARMVTPTLIANNGPICEGNALNLTSETMTPATTYSWTGPNGFTSTAQNPIISSATPAASGTYSVTISTGSCPPVVLNTTVTVNPGPTPTFTAVAPICSGDTLSPLPTTSNEGVAGTWSPALNNTATTTYTFTPNSGLCSGATTMTITVNPVVTPTFAAVAPICSGNTIAALPTTSNEGVTGTWSPALDNTATTTYTFTPDAGQCSPTTTMTITVNSAATITGTLSVCESSSTQLTGSGTPATTNAWTSSDTTVATVNNTGLVTGVAAGTATITYTDSNGCTTTASVTVNALPTISGTLTICMGATTQLAGSGTPAATNAWQSSDTAVATVDSSGLITSVSPGTTTITYTDINGCSITSLVTINALPTISGTLTVCSGLTTQLTGSGTPAATNAWVSSDTAIATIDGTGLVTGVTAGSVTITYTDNNGCTTTASVTVNALPTISGTLTVCVGENSQLTGSATPDATNAWTSSDTSVITVDPTGLITGISAGTATITYANNNGCIITATADVLPTPTANIAISGGNPICGGSATNITITGTPDATVNYTVNGTPATVTLPASGSVTFSTGNLSADTTYQLTDVTSLSGCTGTSSQSAVVTIAAQPTASISNDTSVCSNTSTFVTFTGTPGATVEYTVNSGGIQTVTLDGTGTAQVSTGNLTADAVYTVVNAIAGTTPNCVQPLTGSSTVTVVQRPTVIANPNSQSLCSGQSTGIELTGTVPNTTFTWTVTQTGGVTGASNGSGDIISQVLTAGTTTGTVTYTITPSSSSTCAGTPITVTVTVNPIPTVNVSPTSLSICTGDTATITMSSPVSTATFSWNAVQLGGVTGATSGSGTTISDVLTASGTTIGYVTYYITPANSGCYGTPVPVTVTVYPKPKVMASPTTDTICSGETTHIVLTSDVPGTTYSWSVLPSGVFGAFSGSGNVINQTLTTAGLTPGTVIYTITPTVNGCVGNPTTVTVTVNPVPELFPPAPPQPICSGQSTGITVTPNIPGTSIIWTVLQNGVTGGFNGSGTETTPGAGIPISQVLTTTGDTQGTATYTITPVYGNCSGTPITMVVLVNPTPKTNIPDGIICVDAATGALIYGYTMDTGLSEADYDFQWYFNGDMNNVIATGSSYTATEAGQYTVSIMNAVTGCSDVFIVDVTASNPATTATAVVTNYFEDSQVITVTVAGNGSYLYSLDGGEFQTSNVFPNVLPGLHTVTIHDAIGCTDLTLTNILTIGYPHFFTPNGDGFNDTWNIWSLSEDQPNAEIHIFDRYGKLIKQLVPSGEGWDGTFNGQIMPSTDYWFTVKYKENGAERIFKAHFSMKR